jgi:hypothetical protein
VGNTRAHKDWLHRFPPFRMPRFRRAHHHHDSEVAVAAAFFTALARLFVLELVVAVWLIEVEAWLVVWFYYGTFLGLRWVYRNNVIGQTWTSLTRGRQKTAASSAPYATPVDLAHGQTAAWITSQDPYAGMGVDARRYDATPPDEPPTGDMRRRA